MRKGPRYKAAPPNGNNSATRNNLGVVQAKPHQMRRGVLSQQGDADGLVRRRAGTPDNEVAKTVTRHRCEVFLNGDAKELA